MRKKILFRASIGFTLVELLVVIFIIGLLASILLPALASVFDRGRKHACQVEIQQIETGISLYEEDYRDYPPSELALLGLAKHNHINNGIEALVLCLSGTHRSRSYMEFREQQLENTDADISPIPVKRLAGSKFQTNQLFELVDPWGNPYIYFHNRKYLPTTQDAYILEGKKTMVAPDLLPNKIGIIRGSNRYQIISAGSDGKVASKDDVKSE